MDVKAFSPLKRRFNSLIQCINEEGGRLVFVGGCVRDILRNEPPKDFDAEVYGLDADSLQSLLKSFGPVKTIGKSFGVFYSQPLDIEVALPRQDEKKGKGHRGFHIQTDASLSFKEASKRRDLTINSLGYDPLEKKLFDPWGGQKDLKEKVLRATDPHHFGEDPLRALRVAQFAARFDMHPTDHLLELCAAQNLSELPKERFLEEFKKLFSKGIRPSNGLAFLKTTALDRYFPGLSITKKLMDSLDRASVFDGDKFILMLALSVLHSNSMNFLQTLGVSNKIHKLVSLYAKAYEFFKQELDQNYGARKSAFMVLEGNGSIDLFLFLLKLMNHGDLYALFKKSQALNLDKIRPMIQGKHLIEWDIAPQSDFKIILSECHTIQLKEGLFDLEKIWTRWMDTSKKRMECQRSPM